MKTSTMQILEDEEKGHPLDASKNTAKNVVLSG